MSLKIVHIFFIVASTLMCIGIAVFRLSAWSADGQAAALVQGLMAGIGAVALVAYAWHFIRKYAGLGYP